MSKPAYTTYLPYVTTVANTNSTALSYQLYPTIGASHPGWQSAGPGAFPSLRVENATEDEFQWLRRRVAEVCEAVAA